MVQWLLELVLNRTGIPNTAVRVNIVVGYPRGTSYSGIMVLLLLGDSVDRSGARRLDAGSGDGPIQCGKGGSIQV